MALGRGLFILSTTKIQRNVRILCLELNTPKGIASRGRFSVYPASDDEGSLGRGFVPERFTFQTLEMYHRSGKSYAFFEGECLCPIRVDFLLAA